MEIKNFPYSNIMLNDSTKKVPLERCQFIVIRYFIWNYYDFNTLKAAWIPFTRISINMYEVLSIKCQLILSCSQPRFNVFISLQREKERSKKKNNTKRAIQQSSPSSVLQIEHSFCIESLIHSIHMFGVFGPRCGDFFSFLMLKRAVFSWSIDVDPNEFIAFFVHIFLVSVLFWAECSSCCFFFHIEFTCVNVFELIWFDCSTHGESECMRFAKRKRSKLTNFK